MSSRTRTRQNKNISTYPRLETKLKMRTVYFLRITYYKDSLIRDAREAQVRSCKHFEATRDRGIGKVTPREEKENVSFVYRTRSAIASRERPSAFRQSTRICGEVDARRYDHAIYKVTVSNDEV